MAEESFEAYHVPQQSRRDKLRVIAQNQPSLLESSTNLSGCSNLLPLYESSLIPSDFLSCANNLHKENPGFGLKEEASNLMAFSSSSSSSSSVSHFLDPESSLPLNPGTIQVFNNNPFLYSTQNLREFDQSYNNGGEMMVFKPEPLSLSLSSHQTNLQRYGSPIYGDNKVSGGCVNVPGALVGNEVSRNSVVPLGPFTGYASILKGSRFLKPGQQLLEELCGVGVRGVFAEKITPDLSLMEPPNSETLRESGIAEDPIGCGEDGGEGRRKKSRLLTMLDEVYKRYRQYYQQMHAVVTSFEFVAGLGNAAPYASLAVKAMSKHFRCLKNAITDQLQFANKAHFHISGRKDEPSRLDNNDRGPYGQKHVHNAGFLDHHQPVWRPQRGLPERAVTVLRAWLFEHFLHPYPTDTDKLMLAKQTGLSRSQVSNWFINARVRLWKPMVEEIHMLETRQAQKSSQRDENNRNRPNGHLPLDNTLASENPSTSADKFQDAPYKRTRNELPDLPANRNQEQLNLPYTSNNQPVGVGVSMAAGATNGVSLTLGLHQNHGIVLSEPFPMSAAQRLGLALEPNNEGYVMGGFETQNRPFGRDVIGGQLLHDFVG